VNVDETFVEDGEGYDPTEELELDMKGKERTKKDGASA
jgi:hypothetical protein